MSETFEAGEEQSDSCWEICPHCGAKFGDCWEYLTDKPAVQECHDCGKSYEAWAEYEVTYCTRPSPTKEEGEP